ncbi:MAG TPA: hypothetical protein VM734_13125 [Kofleriaceae bacterium]|jgi:hypothetical protein|nr:hypothetical protein [Kofleriaceae bacterium]
MGGCTNCGSKSGCDHRKGSMMDAVEAALAHLYPSRTWGAPGELATGVGAGAAGEAGALADELASELDAAVFVRPGGADEHCDYLYVLCVGRPPCAVQVRDAGVPPPAEWRGARVDEHYLRIALSTLTRMAAVQEVAVDAEDDGEGYVIRERARAGVYSAPLLRRFQRLVAILPAYDILHVDMGEIAGPPPGFDPGPWPALYAGVPAYANYLFYPQPTTMTVTTWVPAGRP